MAKTKRLTATLLALSIVLIGFAIQAYGKDNARHGPAPTLTLHGKVDDGYQVLRHHHRNASAKPVDTVMAVPVYGGNLDSRSMLNSKAATLKPGGAFSLSLEKNADWLLVLMNFAAAGPDRFAGVIAFPTGDPENTLLLLPVSTAAVSKLNIGKVDAAGDVGLAQKPIDAADFSMTPGQLITLARNDDPFMNVKNLVLNFGAAAPGVFYTLRPDFQWFGDYAGINNAFPDPAAYLYRHYNFQLDSNSGELTIDQVCGTLGVPRVPVELYPPATINTTNPSLIYDPATPIANDNAVCSIAADGAVEVTEPVNGDFFASNRYGDISYSFGVGLLTDPIPSGLWFYKVGGLERAWFDFGGPVYAPRTSGGQVNGFAPVIRVNTAADGRITSVDVRWYQYNAATVMYEEIADLLDLSYLIGSAGIFFENSFSGLHRYESVSFDPVTQTSVTPVNTWYYGTSGPAGEQAQSIGAFYPSAGLGYFFSFFRP